MNHDPESHDPARNDSSATEGSQAGPFEDESNPEESRTSDDFSRNVKDAFRSGAEDAKKAFDKVYPKAKEDLSKGVHDLAYAVAYATTFGSALLREVTPENLREGLREGSEAGRRAAEEVIRDRRDRAARKASESPIDDPGTEGAPA